VEKFSAKKNNRKWFTNLSFTPLVALTIRDQQSRRTLQRHGTTVTTPRTAILARRTIANTTLTAITASIHRFRLVTQEFSQLIQELVTIFLDHLLSSVMTLITTCLIATLNLSLLIL